MWPDLPRHRGRGGKASDGVEMLEQELKAPGRIEIPDIDNLPDDLWTVTTIVLSGRDPDTHRRRRNWPSSV